MKKYYDSLMDDFIPSNIICLNGTKVYLPLLAYVYIIYDDRIIVYHAIEDIEEKFPVENSGRNIWCYDYKGNVLWKIEESPRYFDWVKRGINTDNRVPKRLDNGKIIYYGFDNRRDPYTSLVYDEKGDNLYVFVQGRRYELDRETGKVGNYVDMK